MTSIAYLNGEFLPLSEAKVSVLDRGFLFGDGIYEVWGVLDGRLVDADSHMSRLMRSLREVSLSLSLSSAEILALQRQLIARNDLKEGLIYLQVTRGAAERDFSFPAAAQPSLLLFTQAKAILASEAARTGVAVKSVPDLRWARCDIKSVALLAPVLARQAAIAAGCQEAWMVKDGLVTEGSSSSAFIVRDGVVVTRPLSNDVLPGCTRKAVLALAAEGRIAFDERPFTLEEALGASEAFLTSASSFLHPVVRIDGANVGTGRPGPVATRLRQLYVDFARETSV